MADDLIVTSGKAMRAARENGVVLPFPSGNNYRVRPPTTAALLRRGDLPNVLISFLVDVFYHSVTLQKVEDYITANQQREGALDLMRSFKVVCQEMFMEPKIVDEPQGENEAAIDDVPTEDQLFAFRAAFVGVDALRPFRDQSQPDVASMAGDENISPATE